VSVDATVADEVAVLRPAGFEAFYRSSWRAVYRPLAATIGDPDLAAEAVDEAMTRAYARWASLHSVGNLEGWVYRVAYRWAVDRLRRRVRERVLLARLRPRYDDPAPSAEPGLQPALARLPIEQRAVVVLACAFDWSEHDIAVALSIRPGTVKSRIHRGLMRLREEMGA
jgi:RNA polymerase sigma-70 factor (ECF subfamily)